MPEPGAWRALLADRRLRFLLVGGFNTVVGYLLFVFLYWALGSALHYLVLVVLAHFLAVINSFLTQRRWVFPDRRAGLAAFWRFNLATLSSLAFGLVAMAVLVDLLAIHPLVAQALVVVLSSIGLYLMHQRYTFR